MLAPWLRGSRPREALDVRRSPGRKRITHPSRSPEGGTVSDHRGVTPGPSSSGAVPSIGHMPRVGSEFASYRIRGVLGRGGMSVVFRADNLRLGNEVALKVMSVELSEDDAFRERFVRESRLAASINHPNIIPIYDAGEEDGLLYIAMRFVEGADLKTLIRQAGPLSLRRAGDIVSQVARGLSVAHQRGLVHRDIKPANILTERAGAAGETVDHAYLTDFGLMKHQFSRSGLTNTGQFLGTVDYVAPEQGGGELGGAPARTAPVGGGGGPDPRIPGPRQAGGPATRHAEGAPGRLH